MARAPRIGLLGGSFNPAHRGHRRISEAALRAFDLDEVWWLVSPGNPLKPAAGMAPLAARLASARAAARGTRIRPTTVEVRLGTRYTADTVAALRRRWPRHRFLWLMGADNLHQFHRWRDWRGLARAVPIAVVARPGYRGATSHAPAMGWLRRSVRPPSLARCWTEWSLPALVFVRFRLDASSATAVRLRRPDWSATPLAARAGSARATPA